MLRVILQLAASLLSALPALLRDARGWRVTAAAEKEQADKDARNAAALKAAQEAIKEPKP